jgi:Mrp family chromosome partitioning ATPase
MCGVDGTRVSVHDDLFVPVPAGEHLHVVSIASFLPGPDTPLAWRGPRKAGAIRQLLGETDWSGIEVLVVDCPPGTGDEPMAVAELIPDADGVVVVTTPQDVALLDSRKCVQFVGQLGTPLLGIVENLSGFVCPACGERVDLFKTGGGERAAGELGVPFLGAVPISRAMVAAGDAGRPLVLDQPDDLSSKALAALAGRLTTSWTRQTTKKEKHAQ